MTSRKMAWKPEIKIEGGEGVTYSSLTSHLGVGTICIHFMLQKRVYAMAVMHYWLSSTLQPSWILALSKQVLMLRIY